MIHKIVVTVIVEPDEDRFHAYCPGLPGIHIDGKSREEAYERARPAIELYLESMREHGEEIVSRNGLAVCPVDDDGVLVRGVEIEFATQG